MAVDKLVDSAQLDSDLGDIAIAIRTKGGTSAQLTFPSGFISAIEAITTGITPTGTINITQSGNTDVTNYATANVASGSASTPATSITANPTISVSSSGLITASVSGSQSVTPSVSAGYVASGTAGTVDVSGSNTQQLTTQAAQTITPTTTDQTIASGKYLTGVQTIKGDANLIAENIADGVSIFGVTGTHSGGGGVDKTVTVSLMQGSSTSYFRSCNIYETTNGIKGNLIGSVPSPSSSATVIVSKDANGFVCELRGGFVSGGGMAWQSVSGGVGVSLLDDSSGNVDLYYVVAYDGTADIPFIDWDD